MKTLRLSGTIAGVIVFSFLFNVVLGQEKIISTEEKLNSLTNEIPALNQKITISVSNVSINEFLRGIANSSGLNINVDPGIDVMVINNFSDVKVQDILLFLVKEYDLDISIIGNIINVYKPQVINSAPKPNNVRFDTVTSYLTLNYQRQSLPMVVKEITEITGRNVILSPGMEGLQVNGYIQAMPFDNAIEKFAFSNGLSMEKTKDNFYILAKSNPIASEPAERGGTGSTKVNRARNPDTEISVVSFDSIQILANNSSLDLLIREVSDKLGINYFISSPIAGTTTLNISGANYKEFLAYALNGTQNSYVCYDNIYVFGGAANPNLKDYRVIKLKYRTVNKLLEIFPESLKSGLELKEFSEMNSILASGPSARINEIENFIGQIDKIVPVILIEVMIVYMNDSYTVATGIEAGLGENPVKSTGKAFPEIDLQLGSETINNLLNSFNGFGSLNIGKVTPNFYLNLKALESQGIVDISSTPKLSALNGHEATMSIGNTEYYIEERTDMFGTQNPQLTTTKSYQAIDAELSLNIKPVVAGNNQITLEIEVNQSDFTARISKYAPPGKMSRKFKSMIRVGDQEMVLLGGLEENRKTDSSAGVPLLSRIPILKWIFSSRSRVKSGTRLNIFIKPTIIN